ncbi:ribonuclease P protein component [Candidatus Dependentiae bacterium]|nr:ribonuclease P protein component [Candidatus Dependentiae bacterium]
MPNFGKSLYHFSEAEISKLFKAAKRVLRHSAFDVLCAPKKLEHGRLMVVVPRRIAKAHARNKIRRQIKSIFYESNLFEHPYDCMVIIKQEALTLSFDQLTKLVMMIPEKAGKCFE